MPRDSSDSAQEALHELHRRSYTRKLKGEIPLPAQLGGTEGTSHSTSGAGPRAAGDPGVGPPRHLRGRRALPTAPFTHPTAPLTTRRSTVLCHPKWRAASAALHRVRRDPQSRRSPHPGRHSPHPLRGTIEPARRVLYRSASADTALAQRQPGRNGHGLGQRRRRTTWPSGGILCVSRLYHA